MKTTPEAKKKILNAFSLLCSIALLAVSAPVCTAAGEKNNAEGTTASSGDNQTISYYAYQKQFEEKPEGGSTVQIKANSFETGSISAVKSSYEGKSEVLLLNEETGRYTYRFSVPQDGLYRIEADYFPIATDGVLDINLTFQIDGKTPFKEAENVFLSKVYGNETEIKQDKSGNDLRPKQVEKPEWRRAAFIDNAGYNPDPFALYLTKGEHQLTIAVDQESIALEQLIINGEYELPSYEDVKKDYDAKGYAQVKGDLQSYRAELAEKKSSLSIYPDRDGSNAALEPSDPSAQKLNIIYNGKPGEWITWTVTPEETGLYRLGFRVSQDDNRGMFNTRRLYINGEVPFAEANAIEFPYSAKWYNYIVGGDDPYLFYMEADKEYEITLECTTGRFADTLQIVQEAVTELNTICRHITMVTGISPDLYRDYDFSTQIPDLNERLIEVRDQLMSELERLSGLMDTSGSELVTIEETIRQLEQFIEKPRSIPSGLSNFRTNISSLGTWMLDMTNQYLTFDTVYLLPEDADMGKAQAGFFSQIWYECKSVYYSFFSDYDISDAKESITVWATTVGRDQINIIRRIVDDEFVPKTDIDVNISIVADSATLLQATLAGKGPDIAMFVEKTLPVNLAARGAICKLDEFAGFEEVSKRFYPSALIPYQFQGGNYGVPNSQGFNLMFCRDDIFAELGIEVPETWDDFYKILPIIQRSNMQVGAGIDSQTGTVGDARVMFETLIMQKGGSFYNEDLTATAFDSPEVLDAFKMWTGFYTEYDLTLVYDVFSYFRSGIMPLVIADYTQYNQFAVAAPEIKGLWSIHPIPGIRQEDGSIKRTESATGTASVLMESAENKEAAFQFLDWWSTEEIQTRYSRELEATMGPAARYNSANVETLRNLAWKPSEYKTIAAQWEQVWDIPSIPSSYYVTRNVTNVFRNVVYKNTNERETLNKYAKIIDKEILRKNKELGIVS